MSKFLLLPVNFIIFQFQVIIDEISMVKVEMLYQLDLRLQEISMKEAPFGGIREGSIQKKLRNFTIGGRGGRSGQIVFLHLFLFFHVLNNVNIQ